MQVTESYVRVKFYEIFARSTPEKREAIIEQMQAVNEALKKVPAELPLLDKTE